MPTIPLILAIDQGTTSSRAIVFTLDGKILTTAQKEFSQHYPADGWVEHAPEDIWQTTKAVAKAAFAEAEASHGRIATIGITNQRETTLVWDKKSGKAIYNAIVWQDRRTADHCTRLKARGHEETVRERTGLLLDPYFSATKIAWILDNVDGARAAANRNKLAFGTVDSFLLWHLTGGQTHATDATNASRTSLYNIEAGAWDADLLRIFNVPSNMLPEVRDCAAEFGETDASIFGRPIPIRAIAGDQQAAAVGQGCFSVGDIKSTYGTGCFILAQTGMKKMTSTAGLLTTVAYQLAGQRTFALEGSIFATGAAVQWLRDGIGIIDDAAETEAIAQSIPHTGGVYLVPAFTGLGAPHWAPHARAAMMGMTRATGRAQLIRATLESVAYQTNDLLSALAENNIVPKVLRVDGGMVKNDWLCQFLADILNTAVERPKVMETTGLGVAALAGMQSGLINGLDGISKMIAFDRRFESDMTTEIRTQLTDGWTDAVRRVLV